ncbi:hypothetical protein AB205_0197990 [Aquarana catesbeiana]|uniref:Organic solute transporter subunit alpha n=1 Tax=Aquarana catesbeiana TaxID=8400 RepID=A0A2G9P966_AQUCT|nr:hypothetical protein AB205_0197990 [Aquarana catesbeiana]
MGFFLRNIQSSRRTCLYLWILGVYPVFCISSIIGMFIPRSSGICNFVASIYHSITLWKFLELITDYFGGKGQMLEVLGHQTVSPNPPPCCCCCCFPNIQVNRHSQRSPPYIRCPQRSPSLYQAIPVESLFTSGNPSGVPPYISGVPPYTRHSQLSPSLHQAIPVESLLTPGNPSGVPPYTRQSQQSPSLRQAIPADSPLHQVSPSEAPSYQVSPSGAPLSSGIPQWSSPLIRSNLRWMNIAVYQLSVVRTLLFFVGLILWTDDKYDYGDLDYTNPNSYINVIIGLSTFLSFYGYLLFYKATKKGLEGYSPRSKFICITLVLVLCGLQNGILETMSALGAIPCVPPWTVETRSQTIYNYSITLEMFFISLFARYCFCRVEPCPESLAQEVMQNKSSQTTSADLYSLPEDEGVCINAAYMSEGDETFCHIEHAPLDKYDFLQENVIIPTRNSRVMSPTRSSGLELGNANLPQARDVSDGAKAPKNRLQVQAQINYIDDATVV